MSKGLVLRSHNSAWLDEKFFKQFKSHYETVSSNPQNQDDKKNKSFVVKKKVMTRKPVDCSSFYAKWLFD